MNTEDWWPAEARLIYTHSLSQQQQQLEQQQQQNEQQHQHEHPPRHRVIQQLQRAAGNRVRSSSLTAVSHRTSTTTPPPMHSPTLWDTEGGWGGRQGSQETAAAADYMAPLILCRSFSTVTAGVCGESGAISGADGNGAHSVVNRGDTLESRRRCRRDPNAPPPDAFLVLTGGTPGSGRSALVRQFFSSDYTHGYEEPDVSASSRNTSSPMLPVNPTDDVSTTDLLVRVDERPTVRLMFDDPDQVNTERWHHLAAQRDQLYAFLLVYSVVDATSFDEALSLLKLISNADRQATRRHVVILVANKSDLVRARQVSTADGRRQAERYGCKFIECSGGINHRVDELLAGLVTQLHVHRERCQEDRGQGGGSNIHQHKHHGFFSRLLHRRSRSCQDLFS